MVLFPTPEWMEEYEKALNADEEMVEAGKGWGVDFNGDFVFEITDLPLDEVKPKDLPSDLTEGVSEDLLEQLGDMSLAEVIKNLADEMKEELPERMRDLMDLMEEYNIVETGTVYSFIGLKDGKCTGMEIMKSPDEKEHGYTLSGSYDNWKKLMTGELDAVQGIMRGDLKLDGDMAKIMQYVKATQRMAKISSELDTEFIF